MKLPKVKSVAPKVFLVTFDKAYDLAMTFLRYQEYYENSKFKGKFFKLDDFMEWYAQKYGNGAFTYPADFDGFNIPGDMIRRVMLTLNNSHYDYVTKYDKLMVRIVSQIQNVEPTWDFYLIGVHKEDTDVSTVNHEVAHGLYATDEVYRQRVNQQIKSVPLSVKQKIFKALKNRGYHKTVFNDEFNAYMATGLRSVMKSARVNRYKKIFQNLFKECCNEYK